MQGHCYLVTLKQLYGPWSMKTKVSMMDKVKFHLDFVTIQLFHVFSLHLELVRALAILKVVNNKFSLTLPYTRTRGGL